MRFRNLKKFFRKRYRDVFGTSITGTTAAQIRAMREKREWSQQTLAKEAGMGQARISLLENPNYHTLSLNTLKRMANVFDVALVVRFVSFSKLFEMLDNETEETLAVPSFQDEFGTETTSITTSDAKVIDLRQCLKTFHLDGPCEGIVHLKPELLYDLYDPKRASGISATVSTPIPPTGAPRENTDTHGQLALGENQYGAILETTHPNEL